MKVLIKNIRKCCGNIYAAAKCCSRLAAISFLFLTVLFAGCIREDNKNRKEDLSWINKTADEATRIAESTSINSSIAFIDRAVFKRSLSVREQFRVLAFKAETWNRIKNAEKAMIYSDSMIGLIEKSGIDNFKAEYAIANYSKGDILIQQNKFNEAYIHYYKSKLIGKQLLDVCTQGEYSYRIGMLLFKQFRFSEAIESFKQAFVETEKCTPNFVNFYRQQEILNNIAYSFEKTGLLDSSFLYAEKALAYITEFDGAFKGKENFNEIAKGVVYATLGRYYKATGEYERAKELLIKSININSKKGAENQDAQFAQLHLADVYFLQKDTKSMKLLLSQVRQSLDSIKNGVAEIEWNRLSSKYYESTGQINLAYKHLSYYTVLQDSVIKDNNNLKNYDVAQQVKLIENQYIISSLEHKNKVKTLYMLVFLVTSALALAIVIFFLFHLRNTKRNINLLKNLNSKIEEQNNKLEETLAELEARNKEKDKILKVVAHDLRTPVASIAMVSELLRDEHNAAERNKLLQLIDASSHNSLNLINELLVSTGLSKQKPIDTQKVEVNDFLTKTVAILQLKAAEKKQKITTSLLPDAGLIGVKKEKVTRVVNNLITNAIKFSNQGTEIHVKAKRINGNIQILVEDQGIGIPENLKSQIFEIENHARREGTDGEKPFGLGLHICKQIVEENGGTISFKSIVDKGSEFCIQFQEIKS